MSSATMSLNEYSTQFRLVNGHYDRVFTRISLRKPDVVLEEEEAERVQKFIAERLMQKQHVDQDENHARSLAKKIIA